MHQRPIVLPSVHQKTDDKTESRVNLAIFCILKEIVCRVCHTIKTNAFDMPVVVVIVIKDYSFCVPGVPGIEFLRNVVPPLTHTSIFSDR